MGGRQFEVIAHAAPHRLDRDAGVQRFADRAAAQRADHLLVRPHPRIALADLTAQSRPELALAHRPQAAALARTTGSTVTDS